MGQRAAEGTPAWIRGVAGAVADSIPGATAEGRGRWATNNTINLLATALGAVVAAMRGGQ